MNIPTTIVILFYTLSTPAFGEIQVLFSPGGGIRDHILKYINGCSSSLEIAVYDFSSGTIAEVLVNAKNRDVKIRIVMDKKKAEKEGSLYGFLKEEGFDVLLLRGRVGGSMHNNFMIFDNKLVLTGSYSWTEYAEKFNYENAIITDEKAVVETYQNEFKRLYVGTGAGAVDTLKAVPQEQIKTEPLPFPPPSGKKVRVEEESPPALTDADASEKEFIDISFEELDKIFGNESTLSRSEKNKKWKQYKGKYVRWTGKVAYRGIGRTDWNRMGIKHTDKLDVELWFDYRMLNKVLSIKEGGIITYTGMLYSKRGYYGSPYRIKNAWIEGLKTSSDTQE